MKIRSFLTATALCTSLFATTVYANPSAGPYLAARQASKTYDFQQSAGFFTQGLLTDPTNPYLLESAMLSFVGLGQFDRAEAIANTMIDNGITSQLAHIVRNVQAAHRGDWDALPTELEAGREIGPLVDAMSQSWALVGKGQMTNAITSFDTTIAEAGLRAYGVYHKVLALASVGDFEGADATLSTSAQNGLRYTRRSAIAHAQILSQLDRNADALKVIDGIFGASLDQQVANLRTALAADETIPFTFVKTAREGMAEVYFAVAQAVNAEASDDYTLIYARAASHLDPTNTDAILMSASLLEKLGQFELSNDAYRSVPDDSPAYQTAELGRSSALREAGKVDAAIEVLQNLQGAYPQYARGHAALGDTLRSAERYSEAIDAYSSAIALYPDSDPIKWLVYYTRGISNHLIDEWPAAEKDFRAALALNPDQPAVLNYLGYSMVELNINMDEALDMIERAVAAEPQNGAIVDSLGWVLFQRGKYQEAVGHLETAASLLAVDPIVNDHLGDAFWAVGRVIEAHFQWNRALSFDPTEEDAARIRRKLEVGLDAVLIEEGAAPLHAADDDN